MTGVSPCRRRPLLPTRAYAAQSPTSPLSPFTVERRPPGPHEVLIDIHYCGVCHSDVHQSRAEWGELGGAVFPMVPGHEITGYVSQVGSQVSRFKKGDAVGVGSFVDSCRQCEPCRQGEEQYCDRGMTVTGITPTYGGYSSRITVDENYVLRIPEGLALDRAAPLLCAGIAAYSPLRHYGVKAGDSLAVVGLGGLGHMAVKFARAMGVKVTVFSNSPAKRAGALALGASHFVLTSEPDSFREFAGCFDFIFDTVTAPHDHNAYLGLLKWDGTLVLLGAPMPSAPLMAFPLIMRRRKIGGSLDGGIRETQEMLEFCARHGVTADIELIPIRDINEAFERLLKGDVHYRFVADVGGLRES